MTQALRQTRPPTQILRASSPKAAYGDGPAVAEPVGMLTRRAVTTSVQDYLEADHRVMSGIMDGVEAMLDDGEVERAGAHFADLDALLRSHIRIEDEVLFPVFDARTRLWGPTQVMLMEHRRVEQLLTEIGAALDEGAATSAAAKLQALRALLVEHGRKEERIVYPQTDETLTPDERRALIEEMVARRRR
jgi:hemerythrin-like domain-containing protein